MLLKVFIVSFISSLRTTVLCIEQNVKELKPYSFPIPLELPFRNERANQCFLRIEDVEIIETVAVYCHIAQAFLGNYIHDYNSRKITEDGVDVSLWIEKPVNIDESITPPESNPDAIKDWKVTTVMDPITHRRLYVTKNADCRLIMYSREGTTNYKINCEQILYFVNVRMNGSAVFSYGQHFRLIVINLCFIYFIYNR